MADATMTNGTLVDAVRTRVADDLARTGVRPGRRRLARDLGVTEHAVRQALDALAAEQKSRHQPSDVLRSGATPSDAPAGEDTPAHLTPNPPGRPTGEPEPSHAHPPVVVDHTPGEPITETAAARARPGGRVHPARRWPLLLIALPAFVAIWGGWVGLGRMAGFGPVEPLPGIATFTIDLAITLPISVEVYSAFALSVWLSGRAHGQAARQFASWSALSSLLVGAAGQVAYHLMEAAGTTVAPWWVTAVVATLPVGTLGMAAALHHLIAEGSRIDEAGQ
ncbi:ABC transporter permease [Actinokineospora sp. 24-640]